MSNEKLTKLKNGMLHYSRTLLRLGSRQKKNYIRFGGPHDLD